MDMNSNIIQIESLSHMPFDDLISLYRQGYKLSENESSIRSLATDRDLHGQRAIADLSATCPGTVATGGTLTLSATASVGMAPYSYHWSVRKPDGIVQTLVNQAINPFTFATDGQYVISVNVTDSCPTGAKTSNTEICTITASATGTDPCATCDRVINYCVSGQCINKKYALYGGVAIGVLVLILAMK